MDIDFINTSQANQISVIKNPFEKQHVSAVHIHWYEFTERWCGSIEFKNGNTKGTQDIPSSKTFEEAVNHLKEIMKSVCKTG